MNVRRVKAAAFGFQAPSKGDAQLQLYAGNGKG